jgi:hypothetical protein
MGQTALLTHVVALGRKKRQLPPKMRSILWPTCRNTQENYYKIANVYLQTFAQLFVINTVFFPLCLVQEKVKDSALNDSRPFREFNLLLIQNDINALNAELKPISHLLALLGARPIFHNSSIKVNQV